MGHFGEGLNLLNGQTVKTKILTNELQNQFGKEQILKIDTHGGWKSLLKAPFQVLRALKKSTNVVILPAHNGLRVYAPLLRWFRPLYRKRKLHYVVIGGWLPQFLQKRKRLKKVLSKFDGIYAETSTMQKALSKIGLNNVFVMPNFKHLDVIDKDQLQKAYQPPYNLCTFSRVMKEKGIETAVQTVRKINAQSGKTVYCLDIYGQVDAGQTAWFQQLKSQFTDEIRYCGCVAPERSVEVLKDYFALLFPTHFYTEGVPGTIIDAYAAGIPVISAKWESFSDVVEDGVTGIGYDFDNQSQFEEILQKVALSPDVLINLKENCLKKATAFLPITALCVLTKQF